MTRSLKKNPFVANRLLRKIDNLNTKAELGERRELNPRVVDSQSTALIHLATSAPLIFQFQTFIIISFLFRR